MLIFYFLSLLFLCIDHFSTCNGCVKPLGTGNNTHDTCLHTFLSPISFPMWPLLCVVGHWVISSMFNAINGFIYVTEVSSLMWSQCFLTMSYRATNSPRSLLPQEVNLSNTSLFSLLWTSWKSAVGLLERIFGKFHKRFQTFPLCESYIRIDNLSSLLNINIHTACEM